MSKPYVRLAEVEVDPRYVNEYRAMLAEEMRLSVEREAGVRLLNAMSLADRPHVFRIFEIYDSRDAYEAHLTTGHFLDYKQQSASMVRALTLHDAGWVSLSAKGDGEPGA